MFRLVAFGPAGVAPYSGLTYKTYSREDVGHWLPGRFVLRDYTLGEDGMTYQLSS